MDLNRLNKLCKQAVQEMNAGNFEAALNTAYQIKSLGFNHAVNYAASGLLIDIGKALGNEKITNEGVELLQNDFKAITINARYAPTAYYNLANGFSALFDFKMMKDPYIACFKETELNQAKVYYRKALSYNLKDAMLISQILVNLGNCFDNLGRVVEALEYYDESLKLKPDHGMGLGNKGKALLRYAVLSGEHKATFIIEAYSLIRQAMKSGVPPEATSTFSRDLMGIRKHFPDKNALDNPPKYPGYIIKARSKFERFLVEFCLENRLYLNICDFCQRCNAAIGDTVTIKKMIVPADEDSYLNLSAYLNQIKQDYVTARFLLVLSQYQGLNLDFVDKYVRTINTLDYSMHNIYTQLVKSSFKNFYDILDKIAYFINDYLKLGIPERNIDFRRIWYSDFKRKTIHKKIQGTRNLSLNAIFDIYKDFENGPYRKLMNTRNALTHRFVNIRMLQKSEDDENMTEDTLLRRTLELAKIVRSTVIYLLHFVHVEETRKERRIKGMFIRKFAHEVPSRLKTRKLHVRKKHYECE